MIRRWLDRRTQNRERAEREHEVLRQRAATIAVEIISAAMVDGDGPMYASEPRAVNRFKHFHNLSAYMVKELVLEQLKLRTTHCRLQGFASDESSDVLWLTATFLPSPDYIPQVEK